jgi:hypothetical protein
VVHKKGIAGRVVNDWMSGQSESDSCGELSEIDGVNS